MSEMIYDLLIHSEITTHVPPAVSLQSRVGQYIDFTLMLRYIVLDF